MPTKIPAATLDALLAYLQSPAGEALSDRDWTNLPTFGGSDPRNTREVWSWDARRLLVGTCADDLRIVPRPRMVSIMLRLSEDEHDMLRTAAQRRQLPLTTWIRGVALREARSH